MIKINITLYIDDRGYDSEFDDFEKYVRLETIKAIENGNATIQLEKGAMAK